METAVLGSMTKEEKQLFLKELCTRLPYGTIYNDIHGDSMVTYIDLEEACVYLPDFDECRRIEDIKPYLRPMSSMTEEERKELRKLCEEDLSEFAGFIKDGHGLSRDGLYMFDKCRQLDFCLSHHLDFRGLIPMGLALEAPEGMYEIHT